MAFAPAVWAAASAVTAAVGTGISAYGLIQQGNAQKREANYNAAVADNNAISAGYAAIQEGQAAQREVEQLRETRTRNVASQRSAAAHAGLMISGSVIDTMGDSVLAAEKEMAMSQYRGRINSYNAINQGSNLRTQSSMLRASGTAAKRASYLQAGGTVLTGAANTGLSYANFKKA